MRLPTHVFLVLSLAACTSRGVAPLGDPPPPPPPPLTRTVDVLAQGPAPRDLIVASGEVIWAEDGVDLIRKVSAAGGVPVTLARFFGAAGLGVVGPAIYWNESRSDVQGQSMTVTVRSGLDGSAPEDLAVVSTGASDTRGVLRGNRVLAAVCSVSPVTCTLRVVPLDGSPPVDLITRSAGIARLEASDSHAYWLENELDAPIWRIPLAGGTAEVVAQPVPQAILGAFAVTAGDLVFSEVDTRAAVPIAQGTSRRVVMVPIAGGTRSLLGERTGDGGVQDLVLVGPDVVWRDDSGLFATPLAGGDTTAVLASPLPPHYAYRSILESGGTLYCSAYDALPEFGGYVGPLDGAAVSGTVSLPTVFAVDKTTIYWSQASGQLSRALLAGGPVQSIAGGFGSRPLIALGGDVLFGAAGPYLKRVSRSGGVPEELLVAEDTIHRLTADAEAAYAVTGAGGLWRIPGAGGAPQLLTRVPFSGGPLRVADGYVYWTQISLPSASGEAIYRVPSGGGDGTLVVDGIASVEDLIVASGFVYFKEMGGGISRVPAGGGAVEPLTGAMWGPMVLAADETHLFAANETEILKLPLGGGTIVPLWQGPLIGPSALAVDAGSVYWTDSYYETVFRLSPK